MRHPELHSNLLTPPDDAKLYDFTTSIGWFEPDGIYCSMGIKNPPLLTQEELKKIIEDWKVRIPHKVCMLSVVDGTNQSDKATRDYAAEVLPDMIDALALVVESALARMASNLFFRIKKQDYPVKVFSDISEAREWLRQYLPNNG